MIRCIFCTFTLFLGCISFGVAQTNQTGHDVSVTIPLGYGIRINRDAGTFPEPYTVTFDYGTDLAAYQSAVTSGQPLQPSYTNISNIKVYARGGVGQWCVYVSASPFPAASGLSVSDIEVRRDRGPVSNLDTPWWLFSNWYGGRQRRTWTMSTTDVEIGCSFIITPAAERFLGANDGAADGWVTLGFNGLDYALNVDGDEEPGIYTSLITYTIVNP